MTRAGMWGEAARFSVTARAPAVRTEILLGRGLVASVADMVAAHAPAHRFAVIADEAVASVAGRAAVRALRDAGRAADLFSLPGGEPSKRPGRWAELVERLAAAGLGRDGAVIAVGGGVVGDMAGFAAATFARGVPLVHVPTTLVAMTDAAIGGKTGLDLEAGKNLVGAFHPPALVVIDPDLLDTLPDDAFADGLAEALKHGAVADSDYFDRIRDDAAALVARDPDAVDRLVEGSVRIKAHVVACDPFEAGERAILNFGHTIAHAIERVSGYRIPHGQAVAMGMVVEARAGERAGITEPGTADRVRDALRDLALPHALPADLADQTPEILRATGADKKTRRGTPRFALLARIGAPARSPGGGWTHELDPSAVTEALSG